MSDNPSTEPKYSLDELSKIVKLFNKQYCDCRCWIGCVITALIVFIIILLYLLMCKPATIYPCPLKSSEKKAVCDFNCESAKERQGD